MASSLAWLDFSEQEQRQVLSIVELFRDRDTVDELGVGVVRDAFSDLLFPGTSTLHSRGRYVLFIPWIYQAIERSPSRRQDPWKYARLTEIRLIDALLDSEDGEGTIGAFARATLKMFPSTVYWAALAKWGILTLPSSQNQYHRWLRAGGHRRSPSASDEDHAPDSRSSAWHASLPPPPDGFPHDVSFRFGPHEGEYVAERIAMTVPGTLLALLIEERVDVAGAGGPWDLAAVVKLPGQMVDQLIHASRFSLVINGAPLLYNLMLSEKSARADRDELRQGFEDRLADWAGEVEARGSELAGWDRGALWDLVAEAGARTPPPTRRFIERWLELVVDGGPSGVAGNAAARTLISDRERAVKRGRARLHNAQALAMWGGDAGTGRMVYRWPYARRIVRDVVAGLGGGDA
jgi:hypothetical protein